MRYRASLFLPVFIDPIYQKCYCVANRLDYLTNKNNQKKKILSLSIHF